MIPAAKPREKPNKRFEGFWPSTPNIAPIKVALPASRVKMMGEDNIHLLMKMILIENIAIHRRSRVHGFTLYRPLHSNFLTIIIMLI